jgi:C1A family cysteine protease
LRCLNNKYIIIKNLAMDEMVHNLGMGWLPDYPDFRDFTVETDKVTLKLKNLGQKESIKTMLSNVTPAKPVKGVLPIPTSKDLRPWFSPIENQGNLGSCTANAGVGLLEYYENRAFGKFIDESRLFLYKVTRDLLGWIGDTGAFVRTTMKAMTLFGVPPEEYWPYVVSKFDIEPSAFLYAFAQNYQAISYYRLDSPGVTRPVLLQKIKMNINLGLPPMFGFTVYNSYTQAAASGKIPYPVPTDRVVGGHAIVTAGYDDNMKIKNTNSGGQETKGALLIRNSWGVSWGDNGYGWLPYDYILNGLAIDWWSLLKNEWIDTGNFG